MQQLRTGLFILPPSVKNAKNAETPCGVRRSRAAAKSGFDFVQRTPMEKKQNCGAGFMGLDVAARVASDFPPSVFCNVFSFFFAKNA
jgi:hypothetical protein